MLIPIGTEVRPRKPPMGNYILIVSNVLIFLFTDFFGGAAGQQLKSLWSLYAAVPDLGQYLTYQFLHGDWLHLAGNMLFLWIFGNAVCDRMGSLCYALFYLAAGVIAGVVFAAFNTNALIGASGAIAAVTTAFLVLYPRVHITMLLWFFVITAFRVPAMIVIVFKIILWDNIIAPGFDHVAVSNVAYSAHLGGYFFGFCVAMGMLLGRAAPQPVRSAGPVEPLATPHWSGAAGSGAASPANHRPGDGFAPAGALEAHTGGATAGTNPRSDQRERLRRRDRALPAPPDYRCATGAAAPGSTRRG